MKRVQIEITTKCNKKCFYCPIETMSNKHMSFEQFKLIVDKYKEPVNFLLQGIGEPFLHPDFMKMIVYIKETEIKHERRNKTLYMSIYRR